MALTMVRVQSCAPWDILRRKMLTPAAIILRIISGDSVAGPRVAIIFVFLMSGSELRGKVDEFQEVTENWCCALACMNVQPVIRR